MIFSDAICPLWASPLVDMGGIPREPVSEGDDTVQSPADQNALTRSGTV